MESVGAIIKLARESRKLTLSQVAEATRISCRHLQSIEDGRHRDLPGGMYNRAFVRAYAEYLGLDAGALVQRFSAEAPQSEKSPKPKIAVTQPSAPSQSSPVLAWSVMLLVSVAGIFFSRHWIKEVFSPYFSRSHAVQVQQSAVVPEQQPAQQQTEPAKPAPIQSAAAPPEPASGEPPAGAAVQAAAPPQPTIPQQLPAAEPAAATEPVQGKLQIRLQASENCWTSVTSDSTRVLSAELKPGDDRSYGAEHQFTIVLGNAGAVHVSINGKPARPLGKPGQVVKVVITEQNLGEFLTAQNP